MEEEEIFQEMSSIDSIINEGGYEQALDYLRNLERENPDSLTIKNKKMGFLIDIGFGLKNREIIEEGLVDLKKMLKNTINTNHKVLLNYNAANGYYSLFSISRNKDIMQLVDNKDLQEAKRRLREALKGVENVGPDLKKRIWTNYGNCLDSIGRTMEALYAYDEALKIDPNFSMAFGNKAIALRFFADISGTYRTAMYIKSYQMLKALTDEDLVRFGGIESKKSFENEIKKIENLFEDRTTLLQNLEHPPYDINNATDFELFYINFCSEHKLFLNFHIHEDNCEASIVDPIFPNIASLIDDIDTYDNLTKYVNQIKEDYMIARLLLIQSQFNREDFNRITRRTTFINTLDYSVFDIYVGLLKSAFREAYNILDKIAIFINGYYNIGLNEGDVQFYSKKDHRCIWQKNKKIREEIRKSGNISLYALYDIFLDFNSEDYKQFRNIRNALVHRKLIVYYSSSSTFDVDDANVSYGDMLTLTIKLLQLVKSAVIYLINFVYLEEKKKRASSP